METIKLTMSSEGIIITEVTEEAVITEEPKEEAKPKKKGKKKDEKEI